MSSIDRLLLLSALALLCAGCPTPITRCERVEQCSRGQICSPQGVCTNPCKPACRADQVCDNSKCYDMNCPGQTCLEGAFCDTGACVFPGCRGARCKPGQTCLTGGVCASTSCGGDPCTDGHYCAETVCADSTCFGIPCPEGQVCAGAKCHSKDCDGRSCGSSHCADDGYCKDCPGKVCGRYEECIEGACQSRDCLTDPASSTCDNECKKAGHVCSTSQVCVGTTCVRKNCPDHTCFPGSYCGDGYSCISDVCLGVVCPDGALCTGDGKCQPTACGDTACPAGQVCPADHCVSALCQGVQCVQGWQCWAGGCYSLTGPDGNPCPQGQLNISGACRTPGGTGARCGAITCPVGFVCDGQACVDQACQAKTCLPTEGCFAGECHPKGAASADAGMTCEEDCDLIIAGECRPTNCGRPILCESYYCPAGFACEDGKCFDVKCYGVHCDRNQRCVEGSCLSTTAPDGGTCQPGTVWLDGACKPEPPIAECGEGCVLNAASQCVPPECLDGSCTGQMCGSPSCFDFCKADELCDGSGVCRSLCANCPKGFACARGEAPPCLPQGCLAVTCPAQTHCVDVGTGPTCEPITCGGATCSKNEACVNGACVDMTCAGVSCNPDQVCYMGTCYPICCPDHGPCGDKTQTICIDGVLFTRQCPDMSCLSDEVCTGQTCRSIMHNSTTCRTIGQEPLYCDGIDHDCNDKVNDYVFYPSRTTKYATYPPRIDSQAQYLKDRAPCTNTTDDPPVDWWVSGIFNDGLNVYLMRFDANPSPSVHHPDTHIPGYGPAGMSSCIQIKMPCSRFMATDMNLKVHGAGAVRCARFYADVMTCNPDGACWAPWVHIYIRNTDKAHWVDIGDWDNPHNWGDWFQPWLDGNFVHHEDLTDENWNPRQVESVLICRDMSTVNDPSDGKDHDAAVGIDGVTVSGCCKPSP